MRIYFKLIFIAGIIAFTFNANLTFSQIRFGPKVGLNFSELTNHTKFITGNQQLYDGYHLGAIAEFRLIKQLFLQPGILITMKGSKYIVGNITTGSTNGFSDFQFSGLYSDIPLNLIYKFDLRSFKILLIAGPNIGSALRGKWTASDTTSSKVHFGKGADDDLKSFDFGISLGGGIEAGRIQLSSQYYMGLRTLSNLTPPLNEQKYKVLTISIAYLFGNDKRVYNDYESRYKLKLWKNKMNRKNKKGVLLKF